MQRIILIIFLSTFSYIKTFGQEGTQVRNHGIYTGLSFGTWFPVGKNRVLGNPLLVGITVDFKYGKNAYGFTFDLIGWPHHNTIDPIKVKFGDSILTRNDFSGGSLTLDYAREFWSKNRLVFEVICGVGYGRLSYYNPDKDTDIGKSSFLANPGLSLRYLIGDRMFIQLKTQYCFANYSLKDDVSTDVRGNFLTTKLIIGSR